MNVKTTDLIESKSENEPPKSGARIKRKAGKN